MNTLAGFSAAAFRTKVRAAMVLGLAEYPTFRFRPTVSSSYPLDGEGVPFDPTAQVTETTRSPVQVPAAITYGDAPEVITGVGSMVPGRMILTLLDDDYSQVEGFTEVDYAGVTYTYSHTAPPMALADVTVWEVHVVARDLR